MSLATQFATAAPPKVVVDGLKLELVAEQPQIVTPIGMTFDQQGRLLVIESHTHFRTETYQGPPADRIRIVDQLETSTPRFRTFYEGSVHTMSLDQHPNGWVYVATRNHIFRLRDDDGDGVSDREESLARLKTTGSHPHNGLCAITFDAAGDVYFGLGENLGEPYDLIAEDGTTLSGGGEGGNIYRMHPDGTGLTRIATGFWNPFGMCFDPAGRMFEVGNDPGESPPCRLCEVVYTGDYGFQYRYGRSGRHPLQAWNGELPGTLPMVSGTGEAPCDVKVIRGALWGTSWGHNRIERFLLQPQGAGWKAAPQTLVIGDARFRPVDFAIAPDGSVYFSDWVDRQYEVHGQGKIWRLRFDNADTLVAKYPGLTDAEKQARALEKSPTLAALGDDDPWIRQAAIAGFAAQSGLPAIEWNSLTSFQKVSWLQLLKWRTEGVSEEVLHKALADADPDVRLAGVRVVADEKRMADRKRLADLLPGSIATPRLLSAVIAALTYLDTGSADNKTDGKIAVQVSKLLWDAVQDGKNPLDVRTSALQQLSPGDVVKRRSDIVAIATSDPSALGDVATWKLLDAAGADADHMQPLADVAARSNLPANRRATAVMALATSRDQYADLLRQLAAGSEGVVRSEAERAVTVDLKSRPDHGRPGSANVDEWFAAIPADGGDANAGERLFFNSAGPSCSRCHSHGGRGAAVGPELTTIGRQLDRRKLLTAILDPSRDIAPQYRTETFVTNEGLVVTGVVASYRNLSNSEEPDRERREELTIVGTDGKPTPLRTADIAQRKEQTTSIMPAGLYEQLTLQELRDLLAFLEASR